MLVTGSINGRRMDKRTQVTLKTIQCFVCAISIINYAVKVLDSANMQQKIKSRNIFGNV
jgi:hypothetical protein